MLSWGSNFFGVNPFIFGIMSQNFGRKIKDNQVISRLKSKDREAFIRVYDEFAPDIYRFAYFKVGQEEEAKDLTSMIFLKAWNHIQNNSLTDANTLRGLLYKIARTSIIDYYRDSGSKRELSLDDDNNPIDVPDEDRDLTQEVDDARRLDQIKSKLPLLKEEYREIIILRFVNDLDIEEIAEATGKTRGNVRVLIHRSISALKNLIQSEADSEAEKK